MAITGRLVDDKASTSNVASYASDVPAAGSETETHICWVANTKAVPTTLPTLSGGGLTWTQEETVHFDTNMRLTAFRARGTNTAAAVTADFGGTSQTGCIIIWGAWAGVDGTTNEGVVQSEVANGVDATSAAPPLAAIGANNAVASGAVCNIGGDITPESGFAELSDVEYATPVASAHMMWAVTTDNTPVHTAPSAASWRVIAVELKVAGGDATVTPAAIAAPVSLPAASASAASTVAPATIAAPVTVPQASLSAGSTMTPAAIATPVGIPQAALSAQSTVTPGVIPLAAALPLPTASAVGIVTPSVVAIAVGLPSPVASAGSTVTPAVVALVMALPLPQATGVSSATATPAVITLVLVLPAPVITVPDTWRVIVPSAAAAVTGSGSGTLTPPTGSAVTGPGGGTITPPTSPPITVP